MNNFYRPRRFSRGNRSSRFSAPKVTPQGQVIRAIKTSQAPKDAAAPVVEPTLLKHQSFADFALSPELLAAIVAKKYTQPTPIQDQAIDAILAGHDLIGLANTGTGKTGAFLIPLIQKVIKQPSERVLILTPTRELAVQIYDELRSLTRTFRITSVVCIGGDSLGRQQFELRKNPQFIIATPGRLKDHMQRSGLNLSVFHSVVLDEADRMVDIGFIQDIRLFISKLPQDRQSLFFSATMPNDVKDIVKAFVKDPVTVSVKQQETASTIRQDIVQVPAGKNKIDHLHEILIQEGFDKVLIFGKTKWGVEKLSKELNKRGFRVDSIHGNKRQGQRQRTLDRFKRNEITVLLATDVASRGLDIRDVSHVINYDMPASYEDYVHRIGRTGRANKSGVALTFIEGDVKHF